MMGVATTVLAFTGNGISPRKDSRSRSIIGNLYTDPDVNLTKWEYKHPQFLRMLRENRGRILGAFVSLMDAEPAKGKWDGRMTAWQRIVAARLLTVTGIDLTDYWTEVGDAEEDTGVDLTDVMADLHKFSTDEGVHKIEGEWMSAQEATDLISAIHWDLFRITSEDRRGRYASRRVSTVLAGRSGNRFGDYILHSKKMNLGERTGYHIRSVFRVELRRRGPGSRDLSKLVEIVSAGKRAE